MHKRIDPRNGPAAYDLELMLTSKQQGGSRSHESGGKPSDTKHAGAQAPGNGY